MPCTQLHRKLQFWTFWTLNKSFQIFSLGIGNDFIMNISTKYTIYIFIFIHFQWIYLIKIIEITWQKCQNREISVSNNFVVLFCYINPYFLNSIRFSLSQWSRETRCILRSAMLSIFASHNRHWTVFGKLITLKSYEKYS